jgi:hypothetical protein
MVEFGEATTAMPAKTATTGWSGMPALTNTTRANLKGAPSRLKA